MGKLKNFVTSLHLKTKRNYLERMIDNKVFCMNISKKYGYEYWDGNRRYGYGGYKFIPGRSTNVAKKLIRTYKLTNKSSILDIGCGKGYLLYEIKKILPKIDIHGYDISSYAIKKSKPELKNVFIASSGELTIGSPFTLNEVFNKIGNPDFFSNSLKIE